MTAVSAFENVFWEGVFLATSQGWNSARRVADPGSEDRMSSLRLRVYLVNTHLGWSGAMLTHVRALQQAYQMVSKSDELRAKAQRASVARILAASDPKAAGDEAIQRAAFEAGIADLASTTTYRRVIDAKPEGVAGHWILIVYRLADGTHISRPMYWTSQDDAPPLLTPEELQAQVRTAARFDHQSHETRVGRRIAQGGGLVLHSMYA